LKKDIFNGKIKKEYYSYILTYMIFFTVLLIGMGALCVYAFVWGMAANSFGERLLIAAFGGIAFALAGVYLFLELLVIHKFPKYEKIRRILFNSDCYFTDSTSNEYIGEVRTVSGRRNKAAFDMVMLCVEQNRGFEDIKYPKKYRIYTILCIIGIVLMFAYIAVTLKLLENIKSLPQFFQNEYLIFSVFAIVEFVSLILTFFFAFKVGKIRKETRKEYEKFRFGWSFPLYAALSDISVRKSNKKHKFWYDKEQLEQIENLVKSASENAELKLETKGNKAVSFTVIDTLTNRVVFTGSFI